MIGIRIKELRIDNNISQKELAKVLNISYKTISHWEMGYTEPSLDAVVQLKKFFNVSYEDLLE